MTVKKIILICHNEPGIRESLRLILEEKYDLKVTDDSDGCLKDLLFSQIDVLIMALNMPKIDSLEILKQMKSANSGTKVIFTTNYQHVDAAEGAVKQGASDYIVEPFCSKDILEAVEKILKR